MRKRVNRGIAFLMTFIMMLTSIDLPVYASETDTEAESVSEEAAVAGDEEEAVVEDGEPDEDYVFEDKQGASANQVVMVNLNDPAGEPVTLNAGNPSQEGAIFDAASGTLTLSKGVNMLTLSKLASFRKNSTWYYPAIYAGGNLTIIIDSDEELFYCGTEESLGSKTVCGIYVDGNLTVKNADGKSAKVTFKTADGANTAYGMYVAGNLILSKAETGSLEVKSQGSDTSGASYGASVSTAVNVGSGVIFSATGGSSSGSSSYGIITGTVNLGEDSYTYAHAGNANDNQLYISAGLCSQNINADDTAILLCEHGAGGKTGYCLNSTNNAYTERILSITVRPRMGLYPYENGNGAYIPGVIKDHSTDENWGLTEELYGVLCNMTESVEVSVPAGKSMTYGDLQGADFYNFDAGIKANYNFYAVTNEDASDISEGTKAASDVTKYGMTDIIPTTKNRNLNLCFTPHVRDVIYQNFVPGIDGRNTMLTGQTFELEYSTSPECADEEIGFLTFSADQLGDASDIAAAIADGVDESRIKAEAEDGILRITAVGEGLALVIPATVDVIEKFKNGELNANDFIQASIIIDGFDIKVYKPRTYTLNAGGGRFISDQAYGSFYNRILDDFDSIYQNGKEELSFEAPESCTWKVFTENYLTPALKSQGYNQSVYQTPFKYSCTFQKFEPSVGTGNPETVMIPEDMDTLTAVYNETANVAMTFDPQGGTVDWPQSAYGKYQQNNNKYTYTDKENTLFTLPTASKEGYYFVGWKEGWADAQPAGKTNIVKNNITYTAVFLNTSIHFDGDLPDSVDPSMAVPNPTITSQTASVVLDDSAMFLINFDYGHNIYATSFEEGKRYYCFILFTIKNTRYIIPEEALRVTVGNQVFNAIHSHDQTYVAWKEYKVGEIQDPTLILELNGKGELPEFAKNGIRCTLPGESIYSILGRQKADEIFGLRYNEDGKTYKVAWYKDDALTNYIDPEYDTSVSVNPGSDTVTWYAKWIEERQVKKDELTVLVPAPGSYLNSSAGSGEIFNMRRMSGSDEQLYWYYNPYEAVFEGIYNDAAYNDMMTDGAVFKSGKTYYAILRLKVNTDKGYYIDPYDLPDISVNGEQASITVESEERGYKYCIRFPFKPKADFIDISLNYNMPVGPNVVHTMTDVPVGKMLLEGDFSIYDALCIGDMTYTEYKALLQEYDNDTSANKQNFYMDHTPVLVGEMTEGDVIYRADGILGKKNEYDNSSDMFDDYYELREKTILKDTTIYMQWQSNLESITLEYAGSPQCGQQPADYPVKAHYTLGFDDNESVYINDLGWCDEEGNLLAADKKFRAQDTAYLGLFFQLTRSGRYFDKFLMSSTKLVYNGTSYQSKGITGNGVIKFLIPVQTEHVFDEVNGKAVKRNVIESTCETAGSYDEDRDFHCAGCDTDVVDTVHRETPALGHNIKKVDAKEATDTEAGCKEHWVCERCHKYFSDSKAKNEISADSVVIPAKNKPVVPPEAPEVRTITLSENKVEIKIGGTKKLEASLEPENAKETTLTWASSNEKVVTVDKDGNIKGIWFGTAKVTVTTDNGKSAVCDVTVLKGFDDDTEEKVRISPEDMDSYVVPEKQEHKPATPAPVSAKLKDGTEVKVSVSVNYLNAVTYTGKAIKPAEDLGVELELQDILDKAGVTGVAPKDIFKVSFTSKNNKKAGKDTASFYAKISLVKKAKKKFNLTADQEKNLKAILKAENKELKKNKISYTINKASVADLAEVKLHAKLTKDGKLKLNKKEKISGFKNVKIKFKAEDKKASKLSTKAGYSYKVTDADKCRVRITGNTNFTGSITVTAEK